MPVFFVMVIGYVFKRIGLLNKEFVRVANAFNFKCTLPVMLFIDIAGTNIRENFKPSYVGFCAGVTVIAFFGLWLAARLFIRDRSIIGAFVQGCYRSSAAVMGVAFIQNIYGTSGMAPMMIIGCVPLFNIFAVTVLTFEAQDRDANQPLSAVMKKALYGIITNPIILGILLGLVASYINLSFPPMVDKTLSLIASMTTPLALIAIGAGFEGRKALAMIPPTAAICFIKLMALPAIFLPIAMAFGFRDQELIALIVMLGGSTTPSSYVMAQNMKANTVLTSSAIVATTLLSAVSLTFWIFLTRLLGYIQ